ncbi:MAG: ATP-dependent endonuclease [Verrucomicrobiia bacterium]
MRISRVAIKNFRRLQDVEFTLEQDTTIFVGPNNSGKTSAAAAFRIFFKRAEFTISDFNVACIHALDGLGASPEAPTENTPRIQLDLWLTIDANQIEFGRAFSLIPNISAEHDTVGIRLSFEATDADEMRTEFRKTFPVGSKKTLTEYLALGKNLSRHYSVNYYALDAYGENPVASIIDPEEGRRVINGLVRLDFIDAQRNIHDEDTGRYNRLSSAFAAFYKHNLEKPAENEAAMQVIDDNNESLTAHYDKHFAKLLKTVAKLGVPSAHDRTLRLVSSLNPQEALQGSTELYYEDAALKHRLPEAYNGLGFKNLIYMAIQVSHYHAQWMTTINNRPLCQVIFIEEPEVHLHAQVQQVFITNIFRILAATASESGENYIPPQLVISTHSSHVVDTVKFEKVRYFHRCPLRLHGNDPGAPLVASEIFSLESFRADADPDVELTPAEAVGLNPEEHSTLLAKKCQASRESNLHFLRKYMKLTHCDLFFADAAVLVEGTVEKLLMTKMIEEVAPELESRYISVLEVGGAYAHKFASLMKFLGIPYVVITDIDTVEAADARKACPATTHGANTSNATLKFFLGVKERDKMVLIHPNNQIVEEGRCFVTFQRPVNAKLDRSFVEFHGRTLEETFVYENLDLFRTKAISVGYEFAQGADASVIASETYETIRSATFKKTEFALGVAAGTGWVTPRYIVDGLEWLEKKLTPPVVPGAQGGTTLSAAE